MLLSPGQIESQKNNTSISKFPIKPNKEKINITQHNNTACMCMLTANLCEESNPSQQTTSMYTQIPFFLWFPTTASKPT